MSDKEIICERKYLRMIKVGTWEYVERTNGKEVVYIVPIVINNSGEPEFIFIKEWRVPFENYVIGFPAGLVGDVHSQEDIRTAAHRELEEETGYKAGRLRHVISGPPSSGLSNETIHIYVADQLIKINDGGGDDTEDIEIFQVPVHKAERWLVQQEQDFVIDIKAYIGLYFVDYLSLEDS